MLSSLIWKKPIIRVAQVHRTYNMPSHACHLWVQDADCRLGHVWVIFFTNGSTCCSDSVMPHIETAVLQSGKGEPGEANIWRRFQA
jgi:hypothetical protein